MKIIFLIFFTLFSVPSYSSQTFGNKHIKKLKKDLKTYKKRNHVGYLDAQDLVNISNSQEVNTVSQFLNKIPMNYFKQIIMIKPRALQKGSEQFPRMIYFSPSADLIFSYNGHPSHAGYGSIEIIEFNWEKFSFEMRQISFEKDIKVRIDWLNNNKVTSIERDLDLINNLRKVSKYDVNPQICMGCHKGMTYNKNISAFDPQPNWSHYKSWPGSLVESHPFPKFDMHPETGEKFEPMNKGIALTVLKNYQERFSGHERYKYADFSVLDVNSTLSFTEKIYFLNGLRLFRIISSRKDFNKIRFKFLAAVFNCNTLRYELSKIKGLESILNQESSYSTGIGKFSTTLKAFLKSISLPTSLATLNFLDGPGNQFTTPGIAEYTLNWIFTDSKRPYKSVGKLTVPMKSTSPKCDKWSPGSRTEKNLIDEVVAKQKDLDGLKIIEMQKFLENQYN